MDEYRGSEAGPASTPYLTQQVADDSEEEPETTGTGTGQQNTEEDAIPVSKFCCLHIPLVTDRSLSAGRPDAPNE